MLVVCGLQTCCCFRPLVFILIHLFVLQPLHLNLFYLGMATGKSPSGISRPSPSPRG
jgi:hypothetical protein